MKKVLLFITCLFLTGFATAQQVSVEDAQAVAENFMSVRSTRGNAGNLQLAHTFMSLDGTNSEDLYIFNNQNSQGYVIVAADLRVENLILGFSDESAFDYNTIPDNLKWWLSEYAREIDYLRENADEVKATRGKASIKASDNIIVQPLLGNMKWDQGNPYNKLCPKIDGKTCVTGCIATSMAMIMNYHKWPKVGKGVHTDKEYLSLTVDFSKSVYDWNNMLDDYSQSFTTEQADAVAKLMFDCGVAVDMQYDPEGSGGYSEDVPNAFITYFDYDSSLRGKFRSDIPNFEDLLISELKARRPIHYSGNTDEGGHAFVCDGYMQKGTLDYFHFNFGWSGSGDGYFQTLQIEFASDQYIVYGIKANNKIKVNDVYYNKLNDNSVQVTFPADGEYSGNIVVPTSINVEGQTYEVTQIGTSAFGNMANLTGVVIPESVVSISGSAFYGCPALTSIEIKSSEMPAAGLNSFDDEIYSNATLIVPDGMVDQYANEQPWMMFCTIKDGNGYAIEYNKWTTLGTGSGNYTFSVIFSNTSTCQTMERSQKSDSNICQVVAKNWVDDTSLFFKYDKSTNLCTVPAQSTGFTTQYYITDEEGNKELKTGMVYISDVPTYDESCSYDNYPCTFNPTTGVFRLDVVYYVEEGAFGHEDEILALEGSQYKDCSIEISDATKLVEKEDQTATQKLTLKCGDDVAKYRYAILEGNDLKYSDVVKYAQQMADGTVDYTEKSKGFINFISISYPHPGNYVVVIIGLDSDNQYYGDFKYYEVEFVSTKEWNEVSKGTYTYSVWFTKSDGTARKDKNKILSRNITDPTKWKISDIFNEVDFEFYWDQETDIITYTYQKIGDEYEDYGDVYVSNNNQILDSSSSYYGDASYFNRENDTFYFNNVYHGTQYAYKLGVETFNVPGLATDIIQPEAEVRSVESGVRSYNLAGQIVGENYKGLIIKNGKKYLKK